jgi:hypothetical protein
MIKKYVGAGLVAFGLLFSVSFATPIQAASLTSQQISAIIGLLQSFGADQNVINNVSVALGGAPSGSQSCNTFSDITYGTSDTKPGGRVSQLQAWLGISSNTYGFGTYGPKTLALWTSKCAGTQSVKTCRIDYPEGANIRSSTQVNTNECKSYCDMYGNADAASNGGEAVCKFQGTQIANYTAITCRIDYPEGANIRGSYQPTSNECKAYCDLYGSADAASHGGAAVCRYQGSQIVKYGS